MAGAKGVCLERGKMDHWVTRGEQPWGGSEGVGALGWIPGGGSGLGGICSRYLKETFIRTQS